MKLYIRRDKSAGSSLFEVLDEQCNTKYYVKNTKNHIALCGADDKVLLKIKQLTLPAVRTYSLSTSRKSIKFMVNPKKKLCRFYGISWHIRGDYFVKSFDIMDADNSVTATFAKRFCDGGDGYELNINSEHNELFCIGVAVCANLNAEVDKRVLQTV